MTFAATLPQDRIMPIGKKLQVLREHQPSRYTRARTASEISAMFNVFFNADKVANLEQEKSTKGLDLYIDFAVRTWGANRRELEDDRYTGLRTGPMPAAPQLMNKTVQEGVQGYNLIPQHSGEPHPESYSDLAFYETNEWTKTRLILPDGPRDYIALKVVSNALHPLLPHAAVAIVRLDPAPPSGTFALIHDGQHLVLRGFIFEGPTALLYHPTQGILIGEKTERHKLIGYVVATIMPPTGVVPNVLYHDGNPLPFRVPAHARARVE